MSKQLSREKQAIYDAHVNNRATIRDALELVRYDPARISDRDFLLRGFRTNPVPTAILQRAIKILSERES